MSDHTQQLEEHEDHLTTSDGWELGYVAIKAPESIGTLLFFPAMAASVRSLKGFARRVAEQGFTVLLADPRGVGRSPPIPSRKVDFAMHDHLDYDWPAMIARAKELGGHSLGGQLSALYLGQNPSAADGLVTVAACGLSYKHWDWPARPVIYGVYSAFAGLCHLCGYLPGHRVGWGRPCAKTLTLTWSRWGRTGVYTHRDGSSAEACFANFTGRALIVSFQDDLRYAPKKAVDALAKRLSGCTLERWHRSPGEFGVDEIGHFKWRRCEPVWDAIAEWLRNQVKEVRGVTAGEA